MNELAHFTTRAGPISVEVDERADGYELADRGRALDAGTRLLEDILASIRETASSALSAFRDGAHAPDSIEVEFGVKLSAQAGAIVAKTATEGHFLVKLQWSKPQQRSKPTPDGD